MLGNDAMRPTETPMLDDGEEGGVRLWHLVKASEEAELPKQRGGSMRERGGAKAIPEIYLTRLLSMKVDTHTHQHIEIYTPTQTCTHIKKKTHTDTYTVFLSLSPSSPPGNPPEVCG